jgi:hypothetical protein
LKELIKSPVRKKGFEKNGIILEMPGIKDLFLQNRNLLFVEIVGLRK